MKFELNEKEEKAYHKFWKHKCKMKGKGGAIGGRISISFSPTGLGHCVVMSCICGKAKNITDFGSW